MGVYISRRDFLFGFRKRLLKSFSIEETTSGIGELAREGDNALRKGEYLSAIGHFKELLTIQKDNLIARQKLAYCYYKIDKIAEAKEEFLSLLNRGIESNFLYLYLGLCFAKEDRLDKAIEVLKKFFDISKPIVQRAINLQIALYQSSMANKEDFVATIEQAISEQSAMDSRGAHEEQGQ